MNFFQQFQMKHFKMDVFTMVNFWVFSPKNKMLQTLIVNHFFISAAPYWCFQSIQITFKRIVPTLGWGSVWIYNLILLVNVFYFSWPRWKVTADKSISRKPKMYKLLITAGQKLHKLLITTGSNFRETFIKIGGQNW